MNNGELNLIEMIRPLKKTQRQYLCIRVMDNPHSMACKLAGVNEGTPRQWRVHDPLYKRIEKEVLSHQDLLIDSAFSISLAAYLSKSMIGLMSMLDTEKDLDKMDTRERGQYLKAVDSLLKLKRMSSPRLTLEPEGHYEDELLGVNNG
jgi:hypothetical protein